MILGIGFVQSEKLSSLAGHTLQGLCLTSIGRVMYVFLDPSKAFYTWNVYLTWYITR